MADYAISNVPRRVVYANTGVGPYAFTFEILANTDIAVYRGSTLLTLTTDYSVTINSNGTGSVTLVTAGTGNITIVGARAIQRTSDYTTGGDLFASTLNTDLDSQTIYVQQVAETAERGLKAPVVDPTDINMTLPDKATRAGTVLAFDSPSGNPVAGPTIASVGTVLGNIANINTVAGSISNVNTVATNISNVNTVAGISGNVTTVANNNANITTVADDLNEPVSEINTVATNIANVNTVGNNITNVNTVAGISASVTSVAGNATNINTVAGISSAVTNVSSISSAVSGVDSNSTNINTVAGQISPTNNVATVAGIASNVSTVAGISANVTSVAGNSTNINAVAGNSTNINAVAGNATNINAVAGNSTNINTVATNNANVSTVAGISGNVTTVAGISGNVTTVAGISGNVTTVAGISSDVTTVANNVADVTNYADTYLGPKTSDPATRNDSSALQAGDLYFNTVDDVMKVYSGSAWLAAYASLSGALIAANNLSDLASVSAARTNLGLGSSDTPTFAGLTDSGNLTFTGTGNRITGDFSNATVANRLLFQTSTTNGNTNVQAMPNGTSNTTWFKAYNGTDPDNAGMAEFGITASETRLTSNRTGTGTYLPLTMYTGGSERLRIDTSGNVGIGTSSPQASLHIAGAISNAPTGSGVLAGIQSDYAVIHLNGSASTGSFIDFSTSGTDTKGRILYDNTNNYMKFDVNAVERIRIDSSGNVGIGSISPAYKLDVSGNTRANNYYVPTQASGGGFIFEASGNTGVSIGQTSNVLQFYSAGSERMRLSSGGNLGVGTSSPLGKFVVSNGGANGFEVNPDDAVGNKINSYNRSTSAYTTLQFDVSDFRVATGSSATERMRITSGGDIQLSTAGTSILNSSGRKILNQTGGVLQVVQATLTSQVSSTATTYTNIGLSASITPSSTSSKILVICQVSGATGGNAGSFLQIFRNGTAVAQGDANGSRQRTFSQSLYTSAGNSGVPITMNYLDSPASSSSVTYDIRGANLENSTAWYINRSANNDNTSYGYTSVSTLILMEISG